MLPVAPGSYRLSFESAGTYRTEYYDNVTDPALATLVQVSTSDVTRSVSLASNPVVTGTVTKAGGGGLGGIEVSLLEEVQDEDETYWQEVAWDETAADGSSGSARPPVAYVVTSADVSSSISVRYKGEKAGLTSLYKTSNRTAVVTAATAPPRSWPPGPPPAPPAPPAVVKVNPSIKVSGKGGKKKVTLTISVRASGVTPTGRVTIKLGSETLKTVTLKNGRAQVTIKKQKKGKKAYSVTYSGDGSVNSGRAKSKKITIR